MHHATARFLRRVLRLLFPAEGRHRATAPLPPSPRPAAACKPRVPALRGEDVGLVRPYLIAHERRQEAFRQRERRRALVLATLGMDLPEVPR